MLKNVKYLIEKEILMQPLYQKIYTHFYLFNITKNIKEKKSRIKKEKMNQKNRKKEKLEESDQKNRSKKPF